jgi:hypothetical protein
MITIKAIRQNNNVSELQLMKSSLQSMPIITRKQQTSIRLRVSEIDNRIHEIETGKPLGFREVEYKVEGFTYELTAIENVGGVKMYKYNWVNAPRHIESVVKTTFQHKGQPANEAVALSAIRSKIATYEQFKTA